MRGHAELEGGPVEITVTVCDVCESQPTKRYRITEGGREVDVDLCAPHGQPFEAYLTKSAAKPSKARQRPTKKAASRGARKASPRHEKRIYTIEEIEALKTPK